MTEVLNVRDHGDGRLFVDEYYFDLTNEEYDKYLDLLRTIISGLNLDENVLIDEAKPDELWSIVLTLKQKYEIAFSNGCPWPMKATIDQISSELSKHLAIDSEYVATLKDIQEMIACSRNEDGKASFMFQLLLETPSESLKAELLSYQPWQRLDKQEDENLPERVVREVDPQSYGLANDRPYFEVIKPLLSFIYAGNTAEIISGRFQAVQIYFEETLGVVQTVDQLVKAVNNFLSR